MDYNRFIKVGQRENASYVTRKLALHGQSIPTSIELASGTPHPETVPIVGATFKCADGSVLEVDRETMRKITPYQKNEGMPQLLQWIERIHKSYHNPPLLNDSDENRRFGACVTPGAMGAMHLIFSLLLEDGDVVLMEEFNFAGAMINIKNCGGKGVSVPMDEYGVKPDAMRECIANWKEKAIAEGASKDDKLKPPKIFYTVPTGQNPTGIVVPLERKREIYKIAQEHDLLIIEDDPYYYLQYTENLVPSYQAIDVDGRVLRIDSLSKFIAPAIRVGWVSGPSYIIAKVKNIQIVDSMAASCFSQIAVIKLFDKWGMDGFADRIKYLREFYEPSKNAAVEAVREHLSDLVEFHPPSAGIFFWLKLKNIEDSMFLADIELCEKHGVFAVPDYDFCVDNKSGPHIRLCFSRHSTEKTREGIFRLSRFIKDETEKKANKAKNN